MKEIAKLICDDYNQIRNRAFDKKEVDYNEYLEIISVNKFINILRLNILYQRLNLRILGLLDSKPYLRKITILCADIAIIYRSLVKTVVILYSVLLKSKRDTYKSEIQVIIDDNNPSLFAVVKHNDHFVFQNSVNEIFNDLKKEALIITQSQIVLVKNNTITEVRYSKVWHEFVFSRKDIWKASKKLLHELKRTRAKTYKKIALLPEIMSFSIRSCCDYQIIVDSNSLAKFYYEQTSETYKDRVWVVLLSHNISYSYYPLPKSEDSKYLYELFHTDIVASKWYVNSLASKSNVERYMSATRSNDKIVFSIIGNTYSRHKSKSTIKYDCAVTSLSIDERYIIVFDIPVKNLNETRRFCYYDEEHALKHSRIIKSEYLLMFWEDIRSFKDLKILWKPKRHYTRKTILDEAYEDLVIDLSKDQRIMTLDTRLAPCDISLLHRNIPIIGFPLSSAILPYNKSQKHRSIYYSPDNLTKSQLVINQIEGIPVVNGRERLRSFLYNQKLSSELEFKDISEE